MEQTLTLTARNYYSLMKPGIIFGNALTMVAGFALGSRGNLDLWLFLHTFLGLSLVIASASVFNNYIDRELDAKMERTANRPLVTGAILPKEALLFGLVLGGAGFFLLGSYVNLLAFLMALFGFSVYVFIYSLSKAHTVHATLIGSFAGAVPPVVGYVAVTNRFDLGALLLFLTLILWQMPHFFAIAIYRLEDYAQASIPVMPLKRGTVATKLSMYFYILAFIVSSSLLTLFDFTTLFYLITIGLVGLIWLSLCVQGFTCKNETLWARKMFFFSLVAIATMSIMVPIFVR